VRNAIIRYPHLHWFPRYGIGVLNRMQVRIRNAITDSRFREDLLDSRSRLSADCREVNQAETFIFGRG
jgi:hypothetical protein